MLNFWEEGKGQISSYNMQDKALMMAVVYDLYFWYGCWNYKYFNQYLHL